MEMTYADNMLTSEMVGGDSNRGGNQPPAGTADLAALDLNLYNNEGNRVLDTLVEGENYKVTAVFKNYYNKGGFAAVRLYAKQSGGNYQLRNHELVYMEPQGTVYIKQNDGWTFTPGSDGSNPVVTINYFWNGSWEGAEFSLESGEKIIESNYDNNKLEKTYTVDADTTPNEESHYASYYPAKEVQVPVYDTITEKVWTGDVKKIPFTWEEPNYTIRARLVPNINTSRAQTNERPAIHTLADGTEKFGYWVHVKGYPKILIECDKSGNRTGWAYVNGGRFEEKERKVLVGYKTEYVEDTSQPKRYLYPASVFPRPQYMGKSLPITQKSSREPERVYYPFGDYLDREEWRQIIIPIYNPNAWGVKAKVRTFIPEPRDVYVDLEARETKWVMVELPENVRVKGYRPYEINKITVVVHIEENYDPYAPTEYRHRPPADDYDRVFYMCDAAGLQFGEPESYSKNDDDQVVFILVPALKEVMEWVPETSEEWRVGKPVYRTVGGYTFKRIEVQRPEAIHDRPSKIPATQEDIDNMRAVGKDDEGYVKTDGFTIKKVGDKEEYIGVNKERRSQYEGNRIYRLTDIYSVNQGFTNPTQFAMKLNDLQVVYRHRTSKNRYVMLPVKWNLNLQSGETKYMAGEFEVSRTAIERWRGGPLTTIEDHNFEPSILYGSMSNGIATLRTITGYGSVTLNAIAGVDNYCDKDKWSHEFMPSINRNAFDFCKVMTVDELLAFGNVQGGKLNENIENFVIMSHEKVEVTADINIHGWLKNHRD